MLQIWPDQLLDWAVQLQKRGQYAQAEALYRQFLATSPNHAFAHYSLGVICNMTGRAKESAEFFRAAIRLQPDVAEFHKALGTALHALDNDDEAIISFRKCLELRPDFAAAYDQLGLALRDVCRMDEALAAHRRAVELQPANSVFHSDLILTMQYSADQTPEMQLREVHLWNQKYASAPAAPHTNDPDPDRPLRIGYVSADFRVHTCLFFIAPLLRNHDRRQVQIICYAEGNYEDDATRKLRNLVHAWRNTTGLSDDQVAAMIRADRIDILIDLKLHTHQNRLLVFARKPAPVQCTWLGYPGTTGLSTMDYRLTDPGLDPPGEHDHWYSEASIYLPDSFWCYDPLLDEVPPVNELPALKPDAHVTFGCFNSACKLNDTILALWASVLDAVPGAHFLIMAPEGRARPWIADHFERRNIALDRIEFVKRSPRLEYLRLYHRIDIALDTCPYNGHTTSLDSFFMGVPVVSLVGGTVVGRAGLAQCRNIDLSDLVASTPEQYVRIAAELACNLPRLKSLRATLRARMQQSPLMDAPRFARNIEAAFRSMWHRWCHERTNPG